MAALMAAFFARNCKTPCQKGVFDVPLGSPSESPGSLRGPGLSLLLMVRRAYYGVMVDQAFLDRTRQLDDAQKRELAYALLDDVNGSGVVTPYEAAVVDERLADLEANPENEMSSEEFWKRIRRKFG